MAAAVTVGVAHVVYAIIDGSGRRTLHDGHLRKEQKKSFNTFFRSSASAVCGGRGGGG